MAGTLNRDCASAGNEARGVMLDMVVVWVWSWPSFW